MATLSEIAGGVGQHRAKLHSRFASTISSNGRLDRGLVSFQRNRDQPIQSWFKYKEGFSTDLCRYVIEHFAIRRGTILDPFAGVGTALFTARAMGVRSVGIELLPIGFFIMEARLASEQVDPKAFKTIVDRACRTRWSKRAKPEFVFPHIPISIGAFPRQTEIELAGYRTFCAEEIDDPCTRKLFQLAALSILETISFTRKDGQYLRWDHRAKKPRVQGRFDKGDIPSFEVEIRRKLQRMLSDLVDRHAPNANASLFGNGRANRLGSMDIRLGSCLDILPILDNSSIHLVLTSPPYCNRYDYTRTYALELAYLGSAEDEVKTLRQKLLSCTVENHAKDVQLRELYVAAGLERSLGSIQRVFRSASALHEVLEILEGDARAGKINNANIPRMVRNYFLEMCFVVHELARVLKEGGHIVMVNDNVRYNGEEVPVDLIVSDFARKFGLTVKHIWTLPRGKGNSSQQMGAHGREELRKCVYVWQKKE